MIRGIFTYPHTSVAEEMQTVSLEADVISFNASISACGRNSQWRRAMYLGRDSCGYLLEECLWR